MENLFQITLALRNNNLLAAPSFAREVTLRATDLF